MTTTVKRGAGRSANAEKTARHAQRTPLPTKATDPSKTTAAIIKDEVNKVKDTAARTSARRSTRKATTKVEPLPATEPTTTEPTATEQPVAASEPKPKTARKPRARKVAEEPATASEGATTATPEPTAPAAEPEPSPTTEPEPTATAPAKPAKVKAKAAKATEPKPSGVAHPKVVALVDYAKQQGWTAEASADGPQVKVAATRDAERLDTFFVDGKLDLSAMPTYTRSDGSKVLLRNVSAVKKQMDSDPAARPVKAERATRARSATAERPQVDLPFDIREMGNDDAILDAVRGATITWKTDNAAEQSVIVGKKVQLREHPQKVGGEERVLSFFSMEPTKRGMVGGPERHVSLKHLRSVSKG